MNTYAKYFDKNNKYIHILLNDQEIFKKYSEIQDKIRGLIKKKFKSEPAYNDKYIKTKIKIYNKHNKIPKDN